MIVEFVSDLNGLDMGIPTLLTSQIFKNNSNMHKTNGKPLT